MDITIEQFVQLLMWSVIIATPFLIWAITDAQCTQKTKENMETAFKNYPGLIPVINTLIAKYKNEP